MRAALIGNYGVGNLGDEALREYFLRAFPEVSWSVLSASPTGGEFHRLPCGLRSLLLTPWWKTLRVLRHCDAVVFGGGSLFTDVESVRACRIWGWHALWARLLGKPVFLAFQGVGPFRTKAGERIARRVCGRATFISVRDAASARRVRGWGLQVVESADPVLSVATPGRCPGCASDTVALVPRANSGEDFFRACEHLQHDDAKTPKEIWLFEPDNPDERAIAAQLAERFGASVRECRSVRQILTVLPHVRHMVAHRYHAALFAFAAGVPVTIVPQRPGDKLSELADLLGSDGALQTQLERVMAGESALRKALFPGH